MVTSSHRQVLGSLAAGGGLILGLMAEFVATAESTTEASDAKIGEEEQEIGCPVESNGTERFKVAHFDFDYVSKPLLVSLWVLFASVTKVGE